MLACLSPGQSASIARCAFRNSSSCPGFTRKRTALKAVMAFLLAPIAASITVTMHLLPGAPIHRQSLLDQPPDRLGPGGLRLGLMFNPGSEGGLHLRVEAHGDDGTDAGPWAPARSLFFGSY